MAALPVVTQQPYVLIANMNQAKLIPHSTHTPFSACSSRFSREQEEDGSMLSNQALRAPHSVAVEKYTPALEGAENTSCGVQQAAYSSCGQA